MVLCKQFLNKKTGYLNITVRVDGSYIHPYVHRLVCAAFHPVENWEKLQCDHKDNCRTNNRASNLRFVTRQFNNNRKHARIMRMKNKKHTYHQSEYIKAVKGTEVRYFKSGTECAQAFGCSSPLVYMALTGKTPTCYGWRLEWIPDSAPEVQEYKELHTKKIEKHKMDKMEQRRRKAREEYRKKAGPNYRPWGKYKHEVFGRNKYIDIPRLMK